LAPADTGRLKESKTGAMRDSTRAESVILVLLVVGRKAKGDSGGDGIGGAAVVMGFLREKRLPIVASLAVEAVDGRARVLRWGGGARWEVDVGDGGFDERGMGCDNFDGTGAVICEISS